MMSIRGLHAADSRGKWSIGMGLRIGR
jgi:hypothetical protein